LHFITRIVIACLLTHIGIGYGCFVFASPNPKQGTAGRAVKNEGYPILQAALSKENEMNYIAETTSVRRNAKAPSIMVEYVVHLNGINYKRMEYRSQNEENRLLYPIMIQNQYGKWHYTKTRILLDCADFIADEFFNIKIFNNFDPSLMEFKILNNDIDNDEYIIIERTISAQDSMEVLRKMVRLQSNAILARLSNTNIYYKGVTDDHDIVPIRATYKIARNTGIITEDAYFNKNGEFLASTRRFGKVTLVKNLPMSLFELPRGILFFPSKNAEENWNIFTSF